MDGVLIGWLGSWTLPGLKIETWGTHIIGVVVSHPSRKNKDAARVGHPA
jgi:hypothetical protein